ncbi:MAG TPA: DNA polymerase I, partial [Synechococcales bacterium UBA10510]|nr:DNA polymerase I [Synechococcales bacterium UBA10510]
GVVIAFDTAEPTFRHQADASYKAHRDEAPEQFFADLDNLQQILRQDLDIPLCMAPGYEADDVLGTLANRAANAGWRVRILSGDRDLFQLVDDERDIAVLYMGGGPYAKGSGPIQINREAVIARLGVPPEEVVDLKALTGDSSDNIPGVKGVGPKTAITLLKENGHLDGVYATLDKLTGPKDGQGAIKGSLKAKLQADRENAYRSRMLAEILVDIPLPAEPRLGLGSVNVEALAASLERLELHSLGRQAQNFAQLLSADATGASGRDAGNSAGSNQSRGASSDSAATAAQQPGESAIEPAAASAATASAAMASAATARPEGKPEPPALTPELITTAPALAALVQRLEAATDPAAPIALDTETTALNPFEAELVGIGLCWGDGLGDLAYIPIAHQSSPQQPSEPSGEPPAAQLPLDLVLGALAPWLASEGHPKTLQNAKYDRLVLLRHGLSLAGVVMDTLLADYLRDANAKHSLEMLAQRNFGFTPISFTDLVPKGANFSAVPVKEAANYCGMDVHLTWRLTGLLRRQLAELGPALPQLLQEVELPLEPVLAAMEATGIRIDTAVLAKLSQELAVSLASLELQAREAAGGVEFNLASPKQLGELLFDQLGLDRKKSRKTKTGWSTDATVLEKLEDAHPVVPLVLEHRTLSKLKSTYVDALPALVEPETGRV